MAEKPIIFSAPMVRAILEGRKTMTRRILKPQPSEDIGLWLAERKLPYALGDTLWVREAFAIVPQTAYDWRNTPHVRDGDWCAIFRAEWARSHSTSWNSPIHMPRWASRITLAVTAVKVERVQDISEEDARAEGIREFPCLGPYRGPDATFWTYGDGKTDNSAGLTPRDGFRNLWIDIHGEDAWARNEWVAAISFERVNADHSGQ